MSGTSIGHMYSFASKSAMASRWGYRQRMIGSASIPDSKDSLSLVSGRHQVKRGLARTVTPGLMQGFNVAVVRQSLT